MTKKKTEGRADDATTGRGTVKGHHEDPDSRVPEGGKAPSPGEGAGHPSPSASRVADEGNEADGTSGATQGKYEKDVAAAAGEAKTQSGRGHRKHEG